MQTPTLQRELFDDESGYRLLGAETLLTRIQELQKEIEGSKKSDDIECVHKLRVASRRVRTALNIFEETLPKRQVKAWKKAIRNLTRSSGAARDADVLIAYLENFSAQLDPSAAKGLESVKTIQKTRRTALQSDLVKVLDSLEVSDILGDITDNCNEMRRRAGRENPSIKTLTTYAKAHSHIEARIDEVLELGKFVHDRAAIAKHHELRIAAKQLRYTMEIFSTIYRNELRDEIALAKQFQDVLGEMHDYYVWNQNLAVLRQDVPADAKHGLNKLLVHLRKERKSRYESFVSLWDDTMAKGFFAEIEWQTDAGPTSEIVREQLNRERNVALISDVHGNLDALRAVVEDAKRSGLVMFLNAGDAVGFGIYPSEVLQALRSPIFLSVIGNVDLEILEALRRSKPNRGDSGKELALKELSPSDVAYLQSLPKELRYEIGGRRVLVTHGSPDSVDEHIYPDSPEDRLREIAAKASADVIITGHTHLQMNRNVDGVMFLNPGSVGRPVDGDPKAEYAVLRFNPLTVEFKKVSYDVEKLVDKMRKRAVPENQVQVILRAIHSDTIRKQEEALEEKPLWKSPSTMKQVREIAKNLSDEMHAEQDRKLALTVFDKTRQLHSLGTEERYWLSYAALLHDIGISRSRKGHHKLSLRLILNDPTLPFTNKEKYIIGSIARYHRKTLPDNKHFNLKPLSQTEREKVVMLAAILRVADALDYSHGSLVRKLNVRFLPNKIMLECYAIGNHYLEEQSLSKKKNLFEKVFKNDLVVVWKSSKPPQSTHAQVVRGSN